ncbi:MAG TPA: hypothetical protein VLT83_09740 [Opitutaceae bacterium]|nr:hypothetical protein [Opitutaceae bacterium]
MSTPTKRRRAGWWVAGLTVVFAVTAAALLFRPLGGTSERAAKPGVAPKVDIARLGEGTGDRLLREQATMFDPTPLFLPTEWNTTQRPLPTAVQRQPGQVFGTYPPRPMYAEAELVLSVGPEQPLPASPVDLLRAPSRDPFLGFGQEDLSLRPMTSRKGFVEVRKVGNGDLVYARELSDDIAPRTAFLDWQPTEFLVTVTVAGLLGQPANIASSDVEEVDAFFRDYLTKTLRLGERLPPGIYRVVVGP